MFYSVWIWHIINTSEQVYNLPFVNLLTFCIKKYFWARYFPCINPVCRLVYISMMSVIFIRIRNKTRRFLKVPKSLRNKVLRGKLNVAIAKIVILKPSHSFNLIRIFFKITFHSSTLAMLRHLLIPKHLSNFWYKKCLRYKFDTSVNIYHHPANRSYKHFFSCRSL